MATDREACGLGALLPVSCRGRAESFARRLHTRLRSLGGNGGGSTDLLRGADGDEDCLDMGGLESGGWGSGLVGNGEDPDDCEAGEGGYLTQTGNGDASGVGRGAEGGSTKYRSTDRRSSGGVTVQQPLPHSSSSAPGGPSPSPPTGNSPPYSSSPRPRLDSGLESLGSPTSGTPPRPGSNGSESGVAGISSPANGYFSPHNDQGFSSSRWHGSPSPEGDHHHSRSPHQRYPRRKKDIRWPPSSQQTQESVEGGEAALPNFLECFPQTGVESPPETSWSPSSVSPENGAGVGSGIRYPGAVGAGEEHDGRCSAEAYWQHYSYSRHHHHARSPATPPLHSPESLPTNSKGRASPTSYTPPCSPISPEEAFNAYAHGNYSPTAALKSPISEASEEDDASALAFKPDVYPSREDNDDISNGFSSPSRESNGLPPPSPEETKDVGVELSNGHFNENLPELEEQKDISDVCDTSSGDQTDAFTAISLLSYETSRLNLGVAVEPEEIKSEDEAAPLQRDRRPCLEKAEKVMDEEEVLSEDSMERDIQTLADTIYGNLEDRESEDGVVAEIETEEDAVEVVESKEKVVGAIDSQGVVGVETSEEEDAGPAESERGPTGEGESEEEAVMMIESLEGAVGISETDKKPEAEIEEIHLNPGEGACSPEEGIIDEAELRKKYLDADSSDMDLKAVRIICEEMASRAKIIEGDLIVIGVSEEEEVEKLCPEVEAAKITESNEKEKPRKQELKVEEEDDVEREERTPRVRRSTSLKTGKTPPGTPSRKKIVRFADVLGLDLADVRTFLDEIPHVPKSAFQDLEPEGSHEPTITSGVPHWTGPADWELGMTPITRMPRKPRRYHLTPLFPQPGAAADFVDRIRERCVCLESAMEEDMDDEEDDGTEYFGVNGWSVLGTVKVRNLAFHKTVHARASTDGWRSHADVPASYLPGSCDGFSDRFAFELRPGIPPTGGSIAGAPFPRRIPNGGRLEFAVRFQCQGSQYWDNNCGANYVFSVEPNANPAAVTNAKDEGEERPPATPAPVRNQAAFRYLSLPSPDADWATFL